MGKYDLWDGWFEAVEPDEVVFGLAELEEAIRRHLPESARRYETWWSSSQPHAKWVAHGFVASPDLANGRIRFRRRRPSRGRPTLTDVSEGPIATDSPLTNAFGERLVLIGCVSRKLGRPAAARDLYTSALWAKRRAYAEGTGQPWAILSAQHGLVMPDEVIAPYDRALKNESPQARREWAGATFPSIVELCRTLSLHSAEVHAGSAYLQHGLIDALNRSGIQVFWPLRNKRIGEQMEWYDREIGERRATRSRPGAVDSVPGPTPRTAVDLPRLLHVSHIEAFSYRWPDAMEDFEHGWEGEVQWAGRTHRFRHGVGGRRVYAAERCHTVTWIDGQPTVEGVGADDFESSRALLSLVRTPGGAMARTSSEVPAGYRPLDVVRFREHLDAPYARNGMAARIRVDDLAAWALHALLRLGGKSDEISGTAPVANEAVVAVEPPVGLGFTEPVDQTLPPARKRQIAESLVRFGESEVARRPEGTNLDFTGDHSANQLLAVDPFAFLVAVIADQGVKAERAWMVPMELKRRLGHIDAARLLAEPESVFTAFREPTSLHRYVETIPTWILSAADRIVQVYQGDAGRIWNDEPTAALLQDRLRNFDGIGQKKSAMAVEILERDLGVVIHEMHGSDIAYDIHIRRVFLRTGLAERDDLDHMVDVARSVYPERPGAIDAPAWVVGRTWCRPVSPDCPSCTLVEVCARRIDLGSQVRGA